MPTQIKIQDLQLNCLIGCLDPERKKEQPLRVDVCLDFDPKWQPTSDQLVTTWDYSELTNRVSFILKHGRFHLLESAADFLARCFLLPDLSSQPKPNIQSCFIRLTKFEALKGDTLAVVETTLCRDDCVFEQESKSWGSVDVVRENERLGLYRLNVLPGHVIDWHFHNKMRESEYLLSAGFEVKVHDDDFSPRSVASVFEWSTGQRHAYKNTGQEIGSILCIDEPPFDPNDEVLV